MKSVVQIQRQGKVKDVRASAAATGLPVEEVETKVGLIQALILLGLQAVGEALDVEVDRVGWHTVLPNRWAHGRVPAGGSNAARFAWQIRNYPSSCLEYATERRTARSRPRCTSNSIARGRLMRVCSERS